MKGFSQNEYERRINLIVNYLNKNNLDAFMLFNPYNLFYLGLYYYPGKRPISIIITKENNVLAFTPKMEYHEACKIKHINKVYAYDEDFNKKADLFGYLEENFNIKRMKIKNIAVDELSIETQKQMIELFDNVEINDEIMKIRQIKSSEEVEILKKAAYYSDYIVEKGREMLKPGVTELGLLNRMITKTVDKMIEDMGDVVYVPGGPAGALVPSGIRTAMPHALPSGKTVEAGDTMILSCGANVWGYRIECERTFFLGEPDEERIAAFEVMKKAQLLAIDLMQPGAVCGEIEKQVVNFIKESGYGEYIKHRVGHGKGLEEHEEPYIAAGDKTVLKPGMIFSSEPGIYIEGLSGFRHSDIVLITENGNETLTKYPKELKDIIIKI
jgi:Xaa-Pro dipeptidase